MTTNKNENGLLPCPFERGQVWENPENMLMLITSVRQTVDNHKVEYIDEDAEIGSFYASDKAITENIELVNTRAPQTADAKAALDALNRLPCVDSIHSHCTSQYDAACFVVDHYHTIRAALTAQQTDVNQELLDALKSVLSHVENEDVKRVSDQCTLCYSYRKMVRDAIARAEK